MAYILHESIYLSGNQIQQSPACENRFNSVFTTELPPYAKNDKNCLLKLVTREVIFSWRLFPRLLTDLFTNSRVIAAQIRKKSL
jgi:hypothetical protein